MHGDPQTPLDETPEAIAARHRTTYLVLGGIVAVLAVLLLLYRWITAPAPAPGSGETLSARQIAEVAKPLVARLDAAGASGQSRFSGLAVVTGQGEMMTTCHALPQGGALQVAYFDGTSRAESARLNRELNVCFLKVGTTPRTSAILRSADPAKGEKVYVATMPDAKSPAKLVETRVTGIISEPAGTLIQVEAKDDFPTGAPVFDTQGRVLGMIVWPHPLGDFRAAISGSRISKARERQRPIS